MRRVSENELGFDETGRHGVPQAFVPPTGGTAGNGLPIYSWDQAADQLTRSGLGWTFNHGTPVTVSYAFRLSAPGDMPENTGGFSQFNAAQINAAEMALRLWSDVANITFTRVGSGATGPNVYSNNATILFGNYSSGMAGASAFAYLPWPTATAPSDVDGDVWVNVTISTNANPVFGDIGMQTLTHEIGHAIGLSHPGEYDGGNPSYPANATYWQDSRMFTVMSYFGSSGVGGSLNAFAAGPQLHDIAAAQLLYGPNMSTRTGDTVYGFNSNTGLQHYSLTSSSQSPVFAIWDAGGNDTIDFSGFSTASEIDLRQQAFSNAGVGNGGVGVAVGNISIAKGAVIENAVGGSGGDTLIGNTSVNRFTGNGGADAITGAEGTDTAVYATASGSSSWHRNPNGSWTVTATGAGTDTLSTIEFLDFTDRDVFLDRAAQTFTGDGTSDILMRHTSGSLGVWYVSGSSITAAGLGVLNASWNLLGAGDLNGDSRDDIVMQNSGGSLGVWFMNGAAATGGGLGALDSSWSIEAIGDLNGDSRDDLVIWNDNGSLGVWFMNGTAATGASLGSIDKATWDIEGLGDFNGDGRDDILWKDVSGNLGVWFMNGASASGAGLGNIGTSWQIEGLGDFNGDGRDDILMRHDSGSLGVWFMNGASANGAGLGTVDHSFAVAGIGDYNGDGKDDILWWNDNGSLGAWFMNGTSPTGQGYGAVSHDWVLNPG